MVLAESELSHRAAEDSLPLRDAFAVLFFVSVGMLFDPAILVEMPLAVIATFLIIVIGKSLAAYLIVRGFGHSSAVALTISASLAQIGEFSFILATLGTSLGLLPEAGQDLILAGAILSILVNPVFFIALERWQARSPSATPVVGTPSATPVEAPGTAPAQLPSNQDLTTSALTDHAIVVGYGVVGRHLVTSLRTAARPFLVIDDRQDMMAKLRSEGIEALCGNAADPEVLDAANILKANWLLVAIPNVFEAGQIIEKAHKLKPQLVVVARADSDAEAQHLAEHGADKVIIGRREQAHGMIAQTLAGAALQSAEAGSATTL
jgi:CPA2 family monovalent cation:H+ antiporter-2